MDNIFNINKNSKAMIDQLVIFHPDAFMNSYSMQNYGNISSPQQISVGIGTNNQIKNSAGEVSHGNDLISVFNNTLGTTNTGTEENLNFSKAQLNSSIDKMMLFKNCKNLEDHSLRGFRYSDNGLYKTHESKGECNTHDNIYLNQHGVEILSQEVNEKYCNCDLSHMLSGTQSPPFSSSLPLDNMRSETINRNSSQNAADLSYNKKKMSKSDYNLELLKDFEYITETRRNETDGSDIIIYIGKYLNGNKEFTRTWNLLDHARVHLGVKPFTGNMCFKDFTQKGNLLKHMKVHSLPDVDDRKRYFCNLCNSSYTERYNYKAHMSKHHKGK